VTVDLKKPKTIVGARNRRACAQDREDKRTCNKTTH
jgi:hypothetical protein